MPTSVNVPFGENELVAFIKQKNERVFSCLYDNYAAALFITICNVLPDNHMAEDVLQEVFIKIWSRIDQFDPAKGRLYTWMKNIAHNAAVDALRCKASMQQQRTDEVSHSNTGYLISKGDHTDAMGLKKLISKLCPHYQQILELAYFHGYTMAEIARILAIPEGTIKTKMRKAISELKDSFAFQVRPKVTLGVMG